MCNESIWDSLSEMSELFHNFFEMYLYTKVKPISSAAVAEP